MIGVIKTYYDGRGYYFLHDIEKDVIDFLRSDDYNNRCFNPKYFIASEMSGIARILPFEDDDSNNKMLHHVVDCVNHHNYCGIFYDDKLYSYITTSVPGINVSSIPTRNMETKVLKFDDCEILIKTDYYIRSSYLKNDDIKLLMRGIENASR